MQYERYGALLQNPSVLCIWSPKSASVGMVHFCYSWLLLFFIVSHTFECLLFLSEEKLIFLTYPKIGTMPGNSVAWELIEAPCQMLNMRLALARLRPFASLAAAAHRKRCG